MANKLEQRPHLLDKSHIPPSQYICPVTTQRPTTTSCPTSIIISSKIQKLESRNSLPKNHHHLQHSPFPAPPYLKGSINPGTPIDIRTATRTGNSGSVSGVKRRSLPLSNSQAKITKRLPVDPHRIPQYQCQQQSRSVHTFFRTYCIYFKVFLGVRLEERDIFGRRLAVF